MGFFDNWSWRPGLPSLGSKLSIWFVDSEPAGKPLDEYMLVFLAADGEPVEILANRARNPVTFYEGAALREVTEEKEWITFEDRRALIKRFEYVSDPEDLQNDNIQSLPDDWIGVSLPPKELDPERFS
jgi:hypothetical protein